MIEPDGDPEPTLLAATGNLIGTLGLTASIFLIVLGALMLLLRRRIVRLAYPENE